jgi:hypothetical protein
MGIRTMRTVAVAAAAASAILYILIGFEVLDVGSSRTGTNDILSFGLLMGAVYAVIAAVVALVPWRWVLGVVAIVDALVFIGYFALAGVREPPVELWGLLVKASQLVLLGAMAYLLVHREEAAHNRSATTA